jgi:WD40 repeat protein
MTPIPPRCPRLALAALGLFALPLCAEEPCRDCHGDPLPPGAVARLGTVRFRHTDGVCRLAYAPDGSRLATLGRDRTLRVWEAATGRLLFQVREMDTDYYALAFSPDSKTLAVAGGDPYRGGNSALRLFELSTGKEKQRLVGHTQPAYEVAFAPDGKTILSLSAEQAICWDVASGDRLQQWKNRSTAALAIAPDRKTVAWVDGESEDRFIHLTDAVTGKELTKLKGHKHGILSVAYSPDGKYLASGNNSEPIYLWDVAAGKVVRPIQHQQAGMCLKFAPDGKTLAGAASDGSVHLWDVASGKELAALTGYHGWINGLAFAPDGQTLALAGADSQILHRWDVATARALDAGAGHQGQVYALAFAPDGKRLASAGGDWHHNDRSIHLWDPATGQEVRQLTGHAGRVYCVQFSPDGKRLVSGGDKEEGFRVWDVAAGKELPAWKRKTRELDAQSIEARVSAVAFSRDGKWLVSAHDQGTVLLWDAATATEVRSFKGHEGMVHSVALSPDGKLLVTGGIDRTIRVWDVATAKELRHLGELADSIKCVAFSPDGLTVAACCGDYEGTVYLWEVEGGRELGRLTPARARLYQLAFSPDGKLLAGTGADNCLCVWEVATRAERCRFVGRGQGALAVAFAPDGRRVASGAHDTAVLLWDVFAGVASRRDPLSDKEMEQLWADLAGDNARQAHHAIGTLTSCPRQATALLEKKMQAITAMDEERLAKVLADLDHERFPVRERASSDLARLGELAEPFLRQTLQRDPSLEVRRRVELLLAKLDKAKLSPEQVRTLRAFEVLEAIGDAECRQLFEAHLRQGAVGRLGREAQASLRRLER